MQVYATPAGQVVLAFIASLWQAGFAVLDCFFHLSHARLYNGMAAIFAFKP